MKEFWKGFGWLTLSTLPLVISMLMQLLVGGIAMAIHAIIVTIRESLTLGIEYANSEAFMEAYMGNIMSGASTGVFAYHIVATGVFFLWYYLMCVKPNRDVLKTGKVLTWPMVGWSVAIGVTLCVFSTQMVYVSEYILPDLVEQFYEILESAGFGVNALAIIAAIVVAPIGEELLCRGVIQHFALKISRHFWIANVVQALAFGIMHMNWIQGTYAFFIGLALGWLKHRYRTIWVPIIVHFVVNFSTSTWLGYLLDSLPRNLTVDLGVLILGIAGTLGIIALIGKRHDMEG